MPAAGVGAYAGPRFCAYCSFAACSPDPNVLQAWPELAPQPPFPLFLFLAIEWEAHLVAPQVFQTRMNEGVQAGLHLGKVHRAACCPKLH